MRRGSEGTISNKASWTPTYQFYDYDDNQIIDLSDAVDIVLTLREIKSGSTPLTRSLADGDMTLADDNLSVSVSTPRSIMSGVSAGFYEIGVRIVWTDDDDETQVILGTISVYEGL